MLTSKIVTTASIVSPSIVIELVKRIESPTCKTVSTPVTSVSVPPRVNIVLSGEKLSSMKPSSTSKIPSLSSSTSSELIMPSPSVSAAKFNAKAADDKEDVFVGATPPLSSGTVDGGLEAVPTLISQTRNVNCASLENPGLAINRKIASGSINKASPSGTGVGSVLSKSFNWKSVHS